MHFQKDFNVDMLNSDLKFANVCKTVKYHCVITPVLEQEGSVIENLTWCIMKTFINNFREQNFIGNNERIFCLKHQ